LIGTKHTFGGVVAPYRVDVDKPIGSWRSAWKTAKAAANVNCRWHDLRHSFVSRVAAGGARDRTIEELAGWVPPEMLKRYSHVRKEDKETAVAVFDSMPTIQ